MNAMIEAQNAGLEVAGENPFAVAGQGAGASTYMKFTGSSGDFKAGQNDDEIDHGTQFAADIMNSQWQWSFWWDGEVLGTTESFVASNPNGWKIEPDHLPEDPEGKIDMSLAEIRVKQKDRSNNFMDGWTCQAVLGLRKVDGTDEEYTLKLNQGVALNGFRNLLANFGKFYKTKAGMTAIIELEANKYKSKAKNVGWRFAPVLKIVDWATEEDLAAMTGDNPEDYDDVNDVAQIEDQSDDTPEEAPAEEAPKSGRRGRRGKAF